MCADFFRAAKYHSTLVPEVGADGQDGATESAGPRLVIEVAVPRRRETDVSSRASLSGTHAHTAVHPVRLSNLQWRRPSIRGCVDERGGGPTRVPRMVVGGLSSVSCRERRCLRPGLVRTGGCKSGQPPNARRARRRRLR